MGIVSGRVVLVSIRRRHSGAAERRADGMEASTAVAQERSVWGDPPTSRGREGSGAHSSPVSLERTRCSAYPWSPGKLGPDS